MTGGGFQTGLAKEGNPEVGLGPFLQRQGKHDQAAHFSKLQRGCHTFHTDPEGSCSLRELRKENPCDAKG